MMAALNEAFHVTSSTDGGDERLTTDPIVIPHLPLEEITFPSTTSSGDNDDGDDDNDDLSSISMDEIDTPQQGAPSTTPSRPRSIFAHRSKVVDRPSSPACVMMNMSSSSLPNVRTSRSNSRYSKTYQYSYAGGVDPYEHFGITQDYYGDEDEEEKKGQPLQESDSSLNTYERMISGTESSTMRNTTTKKNKSSNVFNVWMSFFTNNNGTTATTTGAAHTRHSAPSLRDLDRQSNKNRNVQSDPALIKSPSKSCLRRGRFSSVVKCPVQNEEPGDDNDESYSGHSDRTVVQFETKVEVFEFQRPVESWAENGWSSWFG